MPVKKHYYTVTIEEITEYEPIFSLGVIVKKAQYSKKILNIELPDDPTAKIVNAVMKEEFKDE